MKRAEYIAAVRQQVPDADIPCCVLMHSKHFTVEQGVRHFRMFAKPEPQPQKRRAIPNPLMITSDWDHYDDRN